MAQRKVEDEYYALFSEAAVVFLDLPDAVFRAGFSEAVKIALLKDPAYFAAIESSAGRIAARDLDAASPVIRRSAELHLRHMAGGKFTEHVFTALKEKDILRMEGPFGSFFLREESAKPIVLLAATR